MTWLPISLALLAAAEGRMAPPAPTLAGSALPGSGRASATEVQAATRAATREPDRMAFLNSIQVYPWSDGAIYRLYAAPERVSDIALQAGEGLVAVAAGDTVRWVVGDTTSGTGDTRQTHILVKPSQAGLMTNLIITTDRRIYRVEITSTAGVAMSGIAWRYPQDELLALQRAHAPTEAALPVAQAIAIETLNFNYGITGDDPSWRPVRVFDDGRQTFIEFPANAEQIEAPPLFLTGPKGEAELLNYRVRGRYYVVDRLFAAAELRLGGTKQRVVRIARTDPAAQRRRAGRRS